MKKFFYYFFLTLMALLYIAAGINHFVNPDFYLRIMPSYLPWHEELVAISGVIEILLGIGLLVPQTRKASAWGTVALLIAIYPANIYSYTNPSPTPVDTLELRQTIALIRLPFQFLLIWWAWYYTKPYLAKPTGADQAL